MKNTLKFLGIIAITAIVALAVTGCPNSTTGFTVTFNSQGGSPVAPITEVESGETISKPTPDPTRDGHTFVGWFKEAAYTNAWNFETDTVTRNITLHAKWNANPFLGAWVGIIPEGPGFGGIVTATVDATTVTFLQPDNSGRKGTYTFEGNTATITPTEISVDGGATWTVQEGSPLNLTLSNGLINHEGILLAKTPSFTGIWNHTNTTERMIAFADMTFIYQRKNISGTFENAFKGNGEFSSANTVTATVTHGWHESTWSDNDAILNALKSQLTETLILTVTVNGFEAESNAELTIASGPVTLIKQ